MNSLASPTEPINPELQELVLQHPAGRRLLVAYGPEASRKMMLTIIRQPYIADALEELTGARLAVISDRPEGSAQLRAWTIRWSGRTMEAAIMAGELDAVVDAASADAGRRHAEFTLEMWNDFGRKMTS